MKVKKHKKKRQFRKVVSQCFPAIEIICKKQVPNRKNFIAKNKDTHPDTHPDEDSDRQTGKNLRLLPSLD